MRDRFLDHKDCHATNNQLIDEWDPGEDEKSRRIFLREFIDLVSSESGCPDKSDDKLSDSEEYLEVRNQRHSISKRAAAYEFPEQTPFRLHF